MFYQENQMTCIYFLLFIQFNVAQESLDRLLTPLTHIDTQIHTYSQFIITS